jgi:small subunit ribosomal protein S16
MVKIRLSRGGAKKRPFYHVIVTDERKKRDGAYIERLGYFNPMALATETGLLIDLARIEHWQKNGAQLSDRVASLVEKYKEQPEKAAAPATEAAKPKAAKKPAAKKTKAAEQPAA